MALQEILQWPRCPPQVEAFFPQLFLALLFQISVTAALTPEEAEMCWRECQGEESALTSPVRCSMPAPLSLPWTYRRGQGCQCDLVFAPHTGPQCGP